MLFKVISMRNKANRLEELFFDMVEKNLSKKVQPKVDDNFFDFSAKTTDAEIHELDMTELFHATIAASRRFEIPYDTDYLKSQSLFELRKGVKRLRDIYIERKKKKQSDKKNKKAKKKKGKKS